MPNSQSPYSAETPPDTRAAQCLAVASAIGIAIALLGVVVLGGWIFDIQAIKSIDPDWATMKANTALGFILSGGALYFVQDRSAHGRIIALLLAGATTVFGLITLTQYFGNFSLGIDQAIFSTQETTLSPGRPAPITAINFTLLGSALLFLCARGRMIRGISQMIAIPALALSYLSLLGYLFSAGSLYQVPGFTTVAMHTAAGQLLLSLAVIASSPETGITRILASESRAGHLGRYLVLLSVILFPLLGWLRSEAVATGIISTEMSIALLISVTLATALAFVLLPLEALIRAEVERERLSTAIAASQHAATTFRNVLNAAPDGMLVASQSGKIVMANAEAEKLFGYERSEMIGQPVELLVPPRRVQAKHRESFWDSTSKRPMAQGLRLTGCRKDGSEVPVEVSLSPLETETGKVVIASIRDITERKRFYKTLEEKNAELERASKAKDHFLANMSHELRTPMTIIIGFVKTLLMQSSGPLNPEQERQTKKIEANATHLLSLLNDLLDLAKVQSGTTEISFEPVDLRSVAEDLEAWLQPLAQQKGLALSLECPARIDLAHSNRRTILQILQNLAGNSIKFTDSGSVRIVVERIFVADRMETRVHVIDTGVGIKAEDHEKLFRPFSQLSKSNASKGTGLGLHLSRQLAQALGGDIVCESNYGQGSTFTLVLPELSNAPAQERLAG
jgi:PAS domain S-box-containing protein